MLVRRFLQLVTAMLQRTLAQQVDDTAAGGMNPVNGFVTVHEAQHLDTGQEPAAFRPVADDFHGVVLSLGHIQEQPGNHQLLVGNKGHATGLFAVAQGGVHDFNNGMSHWSSPSSVDGLNADDTDERGSFFFVLTIRFTCGIPPKFNNKPTCSPVAFR